MLLRNIFVHSEQRVTPDFVTSLGINGTVRAREGRFPPGCQPVTSEFRDQYARVGFSDIFGAKLPVSFRSNTRVEFSDIAGGGTSIVTSRFPPGYQGVFESSDRLTETRFTLMKTVYLRLLPIESRPVLMALAKMDFWHAQIDLGKLTVNYMQQWHTYSLLLMDDRQAE